MRRSIDAGSTVRGPGDRAAVRARPRSHRRNGPRRGDGGDGHLRCGPPRRATARDAGGGPGARPAHRLRAAGRAVLTHSTACTIVWHATVRCRYGAAPTHGAAEVPMIIRAVRGGADLDAARPGAPNELPVEILESKLFGPAIRPGVVPRPELLAWLQ